jgi:hypothetical protein
MASTAAAYRNSDDSGSAKERPFFTVAEIEKFFETCPSELLTRRFRHFLRGIWIAAGRPFGTEIHLFKAVDDYRRACYYKSASTARYNLRAAEDLGLLEIAHRDQRGNCHHIWIRPRTTRDRGLYRRVTTHRLSVSLLLKWRELHRDEARREQAAVTPIRKPSAPAAPPLPPAAPVRKAAEEKTPQPKLTRRECAKFVADMAFHMHGCEGSISTAEGMQHVGPGDPRYRPKMNWREALAAVCREWRRAPESVVEALKFWGHQVETEESS